VAKRTRPTVTLSCNKCGHTETHQGKSELYAILHCIEKYGWGPVGMNKEGKAIWLCDICWDQMPDRRMEAV
jgi:hypothetical protein